MEQNKSKSSAAKYALPLAALVIIVIAVVAFYQSSNNSPVDTANNGPIGGQTSEEARNPDGTQTESPYADGTYSATGNYVSPGGPRDIEVTVTLASGVIVDSTFEGLANDPTSQRFQEEFSENYLPMVTGRSIDEVELTKVSGSSLTPRGFNDALEKIRLQAQS